METGSVLGLSNFPSYFQNNFESMKAKELILFLSMFHRLEALLTLVCLSILFPGMGGGGWKPFFS